MFYQDTSLIRKMAHTFKCARNMLPAHVGKCVGNIPATINTNQDNFFSLLINHFTLPVPCSCTGGVRTTDASEVTYARQLVVTQARAWGVEPIDMVDTNFKGKQYYINM